MVHPTGESESDAPRLAFDRRLNLEFHGSSVTLDAGFLAYRELDDVLGLAALAGAALSDRRRGKNTRHFLTGLLRQSVFGKLAGYKDVNDADRLARDPAMRRIVGGHAVTKQAASASQIGRFETEWLAHSGNFAAPTDLCSQWIDPVHGLLGFRLGQKNTIVPFDPGSSGKCLFRYFKSDTITFSHYTTLVRPKNGRNLCRAHYFPRSSSCPGQDLR